MVETGEGMRPSMACMVRVQTHGTAFSACHMASRSLVYAAHAGPRAPCLSESDAPCPACTTAEAILTALQRNTAALLPRLLGACMRSTIVDRQLEPPMRQV